MYLSTRLTKKKSIFKEYNVEPVFAPIASLQVKELFQLSFGAEHASPAYKSLAPNL